MTPGFVEVSAVYSNEISSTVTSAEVNTAIDQALNDYPAYDRAVVSDDDYSIGRIAFITKIS